MGTMNNGQENPRDIQSINQTDSNLQPTSLQEALDNQKLWKQILSDPNVAQYLKKQQIDKYGDKLADSELRDDDT